MTTLEVSASTSYESTLLEIIQTLPQEYMIKLVEVARSLQSQALSKMDELSESASKAEILADEAHWDAQFAASTDKLHALAAAAREDIRAGKTSEMIFTDDGRIVPGP